MVEIVRSTDNPSARYITVDAVDIVGTISDAPAGPTRYEQTDVHIVKAGDWEDFLRAAAYGGSYGRSASSDASATIYFTGTRLDLYAMKGTTTGIADIYVDGVFKTTVDLSALIAQYKVMVYSTGNLSDELHYLEIRTNEDSPAGKFITLDAAQIWGTISAAPER